MSNDKKNARKRVGTGIIFFLVVFGLLLASIWVRWLFILLSVFIVIAIDIELYRALSKRFKPLYRLPIIIISLSFLSPLIVAFQYRDLEDWYLLKSEDLPLDATWATNLVWLLAYGTLVFVIFLLCLSVLNIVIRVITKGYQHLPHAVTESVSASLVATAFVAVVLFTFAIPNGFIWLCLATICPMIIDVAAYFFGIKFGKRNILNKLSPNKTLAGFIAGLVAGTVFTGLFFLIFLSGEMPYMSTGKAVLFGLAAGLILSLSSQFGDWLASGIKRWTDIKDFGHVLPGHGGILDRFDSILFSLPSTLIIAFLYFLIKR